jgi:hypothetical protein
MNQQITITEPTKITITCDQCGVLTSVARPLVFFSQEAAEASARRHAEEHAGHIVTGTRPAHDYELGVPVILFRAGAGL